MFRQKYEECGSQQLMLLLIELRQKLYRANYALKHAKNKKQKKYLELLINDLREESGFVLLALGEHKKGLAMYQSLTWETHGEKKYNGICWALIEMGYDYEAWKFIEQGLIRFPESYRLLNVMGVLQRRLGHDYEALQYHEKALLLNPENCDTLCYKANVLYGLNLFEEAISIYRKCIEEHPYNAHYFIMLGHCHLEIGYPEEAVEYFKSALDLYDELETYNGLYWAYEEMGLSTDAIEIADKGLRKFPDEDGCLFYNLANAYYNRGWFDEAKEILQKGLEKFPDDEDMEELLKEIEDDSDDPKKGSNVPILLAIILNNIRHYRK
jgi:tetratricopeptide (TPR) repeat protein